MWWCWAIGYVAGGLVASAITYLADLRHRVKEEPLYPLWGMLALWFFFWPLLVMGVALYWMKDREAGDAR